MAHSVDANTIAYWPLKEPPKRHQNYQALLDFTGNGHDLSVTTSDYGCSILSGGPSAATFSLWNTGTNVVEFTSSGASDTLFQGDFTIESWIYIDAFPVGEAEIFSHGSATRFFVTNTQALRFIWNSNSAPQQVSSASSLSLQSWHHVAVTCANSGGDRTVVFYIDGVAVGGGLGPEPIASDGVGADNTVASMFIGGLSGLRISDVVREQYEIVKTFERTNKKTFSDANTFALFFFEETPEIIDYGPLRHSLATYGLQNFGIAKVPLLSDNTNYYCKGADITDTNPYHTRKRQEYIDTFSGADNAWTVSLWFRFDETKSGPWTLFAFNEPGQLNSTQIRATVNDISSNQTLLLSLENGGIVSGSTSNDIATDNRRHMLSIVKDPQFNGTSNYLIYVDGSFLESVNLAEPSGGASNDMTFFVGGYVDSSLNVFNIVSDIADFSISNIARDATYISNEYSRGVYLPRKQRAGHVVTSNTIARWGMDEVNHDDRSIIPSIVAPFSIKSVLYQGAQVVRCGTSALFDFASVDSFSISLWFKRDANAYGVLVQRKTQSSTNTSDGYVLNVSASGTIQFRLSRSSTRVIIETNYAVDFNWHHLVATYDGTSLAAGCHIYIDGVEASLLVVQNNLSGDINSGSVNLAFGGNSDFNLVYDEFFQGNIDEVSIWDMEIGQSDVDELFETSQPVDLSTTTNYANIIGWWRMGEGDTVQITDQINSNNGILGGFNYEPIVDTFPLATIGLAALRNDGIIYNFLPYDGISQYGQTSHDASLTFASGDAYSFAGWIRHDGTSTGDIISKFSGTSGWRFTLNSDGSLVHTQRDDVTGDTRSAQTNVGAVPSDGRFHFVVSTYDGSATAAGLLFRVDDVSVGVSSTTDDSANDFGSTHVINTAASDAGTTNFLKHDVIWIGVYSGIQNNSASYASGALANIITANLLVGWDFLNVLSLNAQEFFYTGANQDYTVPSNATWIEMSGWGPGGGSGYSSSGYAGGSGGFARVRVSTPDITPGAVLTVVIGQGGQPPGASAGPGGNGGWPSGGFGTVGGSSNFAGAGGGGYVGVFDGVPDQANAYIVIGGGSGSSALREGIAAGGLLGNVGGTSGSGGRGTQIAGGNGSNGETPPSPKAGGPLTGGDGENDQFVDLGDGGAGGGAGWFGGGGGGANNASGGGGSSWTFPGGTNVLNITGNNGPRPDIPAPAPNASSLLYPGSPIGEGGPTRTEGGPGYLYIETDGSIVLDAGPSVLNLTVFDGASLSRISGGPPSKTATLNNLNQAIWFNLGDKNYYKSDVGLTDLRTSLLGDWTFQCFVYVESNTANMQIMKWRSVKLDTSTNNALFDLYIDSSLDVVFAWQEGTFNDHVLTSSASLPLRRWAKLDVTCSENAGSRTINIYINGSPAGSLTATNADGGEDGYMIMGIDDHINGFKPFHGGISSVLLTNVVDTPAAILARTSYEEEILPNSDTVSYWNVRNAEAIDLSGLGVSFSNSGSVQELSLGSGFLVEDLYFSRGFIDAGSGLYADSRTSLTDVFNGDGKSWIFSCWYTVNDINSGVLPFTSFGGDGSTQEKNLQFDIRFVNKTDRRIRITTQSGVGVSASATTGSALDVSDDIYRHNLSVIRSDNGDSTSDYLIYRDGILFETLASLANPDGGFDPTNRLRLGENVEGDVWDGLFDDVSFDSIIYDANYLSGYYARNMSRVSIDVGIPNPTVLIGIVDDAGPTTTADVIATVDIRYKMRCVDDGRPAPGYIYWTATIPDFTALQVGFASPPLIGNIVPGSIELLSDWRVDS